MRQFYVMMACLCVVSVEVKAQATCTKCPVLDNPTIVCIGSNCSVISKGCRLTSADNPFSDTRQVHPTPLPNPSQNTGTCTYKIQNSTKTITFKIVNK